MESFELLELARSLNGAVAQYREFLRILSMSCGIYRIPEGAKDPQVPHTEDEVYHVFQGTARIRVGTEDRNVAPGTIVFVPAGVEHRFHDIQETLVALVVFAPAEGALGR